MQYNRPSGRKKQGGNTMAKTVNRRPENAKDWACEGVLKQSVGKNSGDDKVGCDSEAHTIRRHAEAAIRALSIGDIVEASLLIGDIIRTLKQAESHELSFMQISHG
jgi:hypothetical protein